MINQNLSGKPFRLLAGTIVAVAITGCAATQVAISKRDLDVQTRMSNTVFLDPVPQDKRTVYVQVRNTSDKPGFNIDGNLRQAIETKGYRVLKDPNKAYYWLQVNVLQVGKADPSAAERALASGFGGAITGVLVASATGNTSSRDSALGGLLGGIAETIANAMVKDVTYSIITDIQIS